MKYDGIQARNQAANRFYQAAEEAGERSIRQAVRAIGDEIMNDHSGAFGPEKAEALEDVKVIGYISKASQGKVLVTRDGAEFELKAQGWVMPSE